MKSTGFGRIVPEHDGSFPAGTANGTPMRLLAPLVLALGVVVLVVGLPLVGAAGAPPGAVDDTGFQESNATAESAGSQGSNETAAAPSPGAHAAGIAATGNRTTHGIVGQESFRRQLAATDSAEQLGALLARTLNATARRTATLERRQRSLEAARQNGTIGSDAYTVRTASVGSAAASADERIALIEDATAVLPPDVRDEYAFEERIDRLDRRVEALQNRTDEAVGAIDGTDRELRATPVTAADVEDAFARAFAADSRLGDEIDPRRIDLHVRAANGSTQRYAVRTEGGRVTDVSSGSIDDPTVRVYTDYGVIKGIQRSDDPAGVARDALAEDRIVYEGVGLLNSIRYGLVAIAEWIAELV